jgi:MYXO-CTERM domain-containing protein
MSQLLRLIAGGISLVSLLSLSAPAAAYCRSNTCDFRTENCEHDSDGCVTSGHSLSWASSCVTFAVQEDGSQKWDISEERFAEEVNAAFERWLEVDCGDGERPKLEVQNIGPVECDKVEYNQRSGNSNIFMFRDEEWPYAGGEDALGLSTIRFDPTTGNIYDVDVEVNGTDTPISVGDEVRGADLASIITHEVGHFLGLSHSNVRNATMLPGYRPGDDSLRTLELDDIDGICDALNPARSTATDSCVPRHGFSGECGGKKPETGCAVQAPGDSRGGFAIVALAVGLAALGQRRRSRS